MKSKLNCIVLSCILVLQSTFAQHLKQLPTQPPGYAIASAHPLATQAGLQILEQGGNAFDAAIAVAAVLAVVEPYHSGLGGSGFWLLHDEKNHKNIFVDAREVAPKAATQDMFLATDGSVVPGLSLNGALAAAIPGEPALMAYVAKTKGRLPLATDLAPAIELAEKGFLVDNQFRYFLTMGDRQEQLNKNPAAAGIFLKNGKPYSVGERLIQKDLAHTLKSIAEKGRHGFYSGAVADKLVKGVRAAGGIWTLQDLSDYKVRVREPLIGAYHNMLVITAPPPSGGGVALLTMLNILSYYPLETFSKVGWVHYLVEAMRLAFWQGEFVADPDFISVPVAQLTSSENARYLRQFIASKKALGSGILKKAPVPADAQKTNTTHFSIIDAEGNRVAATMTVNYIFGSSVVPEGTGVLLNDGMDDFSTKVGVSNLFGLVGSKKNAIAPGKRPLSMMTPTFLEMPGRVAVLGTPGGSRIPSMVLIASLFFYDGYGAISMVSAMRFHHQYMPDLLQFEPDTFPLALQEQLGLMGYILQPLDQVYGDMQAITWDKEKNLLTASSDPRHMGLSVKRVDKPSGYGVKY